MQPVIRRVGEILIVLAFCYILVGLFLVWSGATITQEDQFAQAIVEAHANPQEVSRAIINMWRAIDEAQIRQKNKGLFNLWEFSPSQLQGLGNVAVFERVAKHICELSDDPERRLSAEVHVFGDAYVGRLVPIVARGLDNQNRACAAAATGAAVVLLIVWCACGGIGWLIGRRNGDARLGLVAGMTLGPVGWFVMFLNDCRPKCPACFGRHDRGASVCRFCGRSLGQSAGC